MSNYKSRPWCTPFWGDIEHKLVYKNTNYYVYDDFMKELLGSIKANLTLTDASAENYL